MFTATSSLSVAEFEAIYGHAGSDRAFEYWKGEAIQKCMPTWTHAFLQAFISHLLTAAGFKVGGDLELRIAANARPRPDIVATRGKMQEPYPTKAAEIVVEILSPDDAMSYLLQKCAAYYNWGFEFVYVVDPENRHLYRWTGKGLSTTDELVSIDVKQIWDALDESIELS